MTDHPKCRRNHPGKHAYISAALAWRVVKRGKPGREAKGKRRLKVLTVYRCTGCGLFYIGKDFRSKRAWFKYGEA